MRRHGILAATGLVVLAAGGSGCRSGCGERTGLFARSSDSCVPVIDREVGRPCDTGGIFSVGRKKHHGNEIPGEVTVLPGSVSPMYSEIPGVPIYPAGVPIPLGGSGGVPNELPPPTITPPGVPERPFAQPIPAAVEAGNVLPLPSGTPTVRPSGSR